ncbi:MAG: chorismate mutase [Acidobacteriota bacterium]
MIRGIRGAIQVSENERLAIVSAADALMTALIAANQIMRPNVSAVFFTVTPDLDAAFPAAVRANLGWEQVSFLCGQEIPVEGGLERVLRVLILVETELAQEQIQHKYLGGAASLRPDLAK